MSRLMSASTMESSASDTSPASEKTPSSLGIVQFGFHAKTSYDADEALLQTRSEGFKLKPAEKDRDIWKRPPPDFRYVVYDPKPPKRNTVDSMRPWDYGTIPGQRTTVSRKRDDGRLPRIFDVKEKEAEIITRFHIDRPFTAKKKFVTQGMNPAGPYDNPKPHDFRQYPSLKKLGLDEFLTTYEKDPYSIKFKSERLNHTPRPEVSPPKEGSRRPPTYRPSTYKDSVYRPSTFRPSTFRPSTFQTTGTLMTSHFDEGYTSPEVHGLPFEPPERDLVPGRQMAPPMSAKKQWDRSLILDKTAWPQKNEAFSRHRRRHRQPYSAFMERVEGDLSGKWYRERLDEAIQSAS